MFRESFASPRARSHHDLRSKPDATAHCPTPHWLLPPPMPTTILQLSCPDRVGLLSRISGFVGQHGGNLIEVHQFTEPEAGWFFTRMAIDPHTLKTDLLDLRGAFLPIAEQLEATWSIRPAESRQRVVLMVSKLSHCLADLLWR